MAWLKLGISETTRSGRVRRQTEAAQDLCSALAPEKKLHHLQEGVGHYGVFNGSRFRREIVPRIVEFVNANA